MTAAKAANTTVGAVYLIVGIVGLFLTTLTQAPEDPGGERHAMHSFGAQFAEVRVNADTGEVRAARMPGVFADGRILNPRTARSQFIGGMTMGIGVALHEAGIMDARFDSIMNHDLSEYHIPTHAGFLDLDAAGHDETDHRAGAWRQGNQ